MIRLSLVALLMAVTLVACGKRNDPERPSAAQSREGVLGPPGTAVETLPPNVGRPYPRS